VDELRRGLLRDELGNVDERPDLCCVCSGPVQHGEQRDELHRLEHMQCWHLCEQHAVSERKPHLHGVSDERIQCHDQRLELHRVEHMQCR